MYRISNNKRKYSTTPIVKVEIGEDGKETETIVCVFTITKKQGDALSEQIIKVLNKNDYESRKSIKKHKIYIIK